MIHISVLNGISLHHWIVELSQIKLFLLDDLNNIMDSLNLPIKQNLNENSFLILMNIEKIILHLQRFIKKLIKRNLKSLNKFFVDFIFY